MARTMTSNMTIKLVANLLATWLRLIVWFTLSEMGKNHLQNRLKISLKTV